MLFFLAITPQSSCSNLISNYDFYYIYMPQTLRMYAVEGPCRALKGTGTKELTWEKLQQSVNKGSQFLQVDFSVQLCLMRRSYNDSSPTHTLLISGFPDLNSYLQHLFQPRVKQNWGVKTNLSLHLLFSLLEALNFFVINLREWSKPVFLHRPETHINLILQDRIDYFPPQGSDCPSLSPL